MLRSSAAASRLASTEAPLPAGLAATVTLWRYSVVLPARLPLVRLAAGFAARLGDDIKVISLLHRFVFLQLQLAIGDAFAGPHVIFHAVPRADEVHLVFREIQTHRGLVRPQAFLDSGDGQALASRAALMQAEITVGVEFAVVPEHADLVVPHKDDAAVAVLEFGKFRNEFFGHKRHTLRFILLARFASGSCLLWLFGVPRPSSVKWGRGTLLAQSSKASDGLNVNPSHATPSPRVRGG